MGLVWGGQCRGSVPLGGGSLSHIEPHKGLCQSDFSHRAPSGAQSIMASALQSALAVGLEVVLQSIGIRTLDDLASGICDRGDEIADYISSSGCRRAAFVARHKSASGRHRQLLDRSAQLRRRHSAELSWRLSFCTPSLQSDVALLVEGVAASSTVAISGDL